MLKPNLKAQKGMVIDGIYSSEAIDSSGEIVKLDGLDISLFEDGQGLLNYEHIGKEGMGKELVGHIIYVKKIKQISDCEDERQRYYYKKAGEVPYLYGIARLYDSAGHEGAKSLAAQIRDHVAHDEQVLVRYSVEGSTLERDGNIVKTSIGRKVACTVIPCNKTCDNSIIVDPNAPEGYEKEPKSIVKAEVILEDPLYKNIGGSKEIECNPILQDSPKTALDQLVEGLELIKSLTAGNYDAAPSSLTQGAALQKEDIQKVYRDHIVGAIKDFDQPFDRKKFKAYLKDRLNKADLPDVSDQFLDHFAGLAEDWQVKKSESQIDQQAMTFYLQAIELENQLIELRKSIREELEPYNIHLPEVYQISYRINNQYCPAGRFMVHDNQIFHLEDNYNLLGSLVPEGAMNANVETTIQALAKNPQFRIQEHQLPEPIKQQGGQEALVQPVQAPIRPAVFEYWRPGMVKPHHVEFGQDYAAIDGQALNHDELTLMLQNARNGLASISWKGSGSPNGGDIQLEDPLNKAEGEDPMDAAVAHLRSMAAAGHIDSKHLDTVLNHIHVDPLSGVGNKYSFMKFMQKQKPGVYTSIDINNFKHINDRFGHPVGDEAIKAMGGALKDAGQKVGDSKIFRPGGDEIVTHHPTLESAHNFLRHLNNHVNSLPPVNGLHRLSFSIGMGPTYEHADSALLEAKKNKIDPISGKARYQPHQTPSFGHSHMPGSEGPLNLHEAPVQQLQPPKAA